MNAHQLQEIASYITRSNTGAIATKMHDCVEVLVPGLQSLPGGAVKRIYTTEKIRSMRSATRLIGAMQ